MNATRLDNLNEAFIKNFITVFLSVVINSINGSFVYIYFRSQDFQRDPRYVLYIHLVINDMMMLSLSVMLQIFSYSLPSCCTLLLILLTTNKNSPLNLACMAVERYIAVCRPLHHPQLCTVGRAYALIGLIWAVSFLPGLGDFLILRLASPGVPGPTSLFPGVVLCYASNIFSTRRHQLNSQVSEVLLLSVVSATLAVTYLKVLSAARTAASSSSSSSASRVSARRARNTILLHGAQLLICMLSYLQVFVVRPLLRTSPHRRTSIIFSGFILTNILPRLLSPLIYGVRDQKFSAQLRLLFCCRRGGRRPRPTAGGRRSKRFKKITFAHRF